MLDTSATNIFLLRLKADGNYINDQPNCSNNVVELVHPPFDGVWEIKVPANYSGEAVLTYGNYTFTITFSGGSGGAPEEPSGTPIEAELGTVDPSTMTFTPSDQKFVGSCTLDTNTAYIFSLRLKADGNYINDQPDCSNEDVILGHPDIDGVWDVMVADDYSGEAVLTYGTPNGNYTFTITFSGGPGEGPEEPSGTPIAAELGAMVDGDFVPGDQNFVGSCVLDTSAARIFFLRLEADGNYINDELSSNNNNVTAMAIGNGILLSVLLLVGLGVNALAAEGFNAGLSVDRNTEGRIIVTVEDSQVLRDQKPRLSIPADETFAEAVVFLENVAETAEYANGMVTFTVYKGGSYCIAVEAELTDSVAATCTQEGRNEYLFDGNTYVETVPALEHDFTDTTRPTCANCEERNPNYVPPFVPTPPQDDSEDEEPSASFTDVEQDAWYVEAVDYVVEQKLFIGVSETEFAPQGTMTRAMFWMVLARMSGENVDGGEVWYEKAMEWAVENELSDGTGHADAVTREQIVTMLWRFAGSPSNSTEIGSFADADSVSDWAKEAMQWACGKGIVEGAGGYLLPGDSAERCQVAAMIMRYLENVVNA